MAADNQRKSVFAWSWLPKSGQLGVHPLEAIDYPLFSDL
jgi:hypothetical protein